MKCDTHRKKANRFTGQEGVDGQTTQLQPSISSGPLTDSEARRCKRGVINIVEGYITEAKVS